MNNRECTTLSRRGVRGFTLIQMLIALAILGTLVGLLIVAMTQARKSATAVADGQTLASLTTGIEAFSSACDFAPPLVRDKAKSDAKTIDTVNVGGSNVSVISVYTPAADGPFLRGENFSINQANPLAAEDRRYSTCSLGFYIAGVLTHPARSSTPDTPIDLVAGPGIGRPNLSGGFEKGKLGPFVDASTRTLNIVRNEDATFPTAEISDRNQVPIRYYRWLKDRNAVKWEDLNIPPMVVGPEYAKYMSTTPAEQRGQPDAQVNAANWAVVMAGANKVFGDEDVTTIVNALRAVGESVDNSTPEATLRARAWADNITRVGNAPN
ncbi:MAG TPA: hypothetical protein VK176_12650 [Phycisphaerales bacterium]|nr:hypothetical protein [Phycisphaerales bacterium]